MKTAIVIPARYGSTRFPGKPLAKINGRTMLSMVVDIAKKAAEGTKDVFVFVTTEDQRIADHAKDIGVECIITSAYCPTGSDRVLECIKKSGQKFDFVINLQGDAPFTPPNTVKRIIEKFRKDPKLEVVTPVHQLSWTDLERLRESKKITPFSGTTVIIDEKGFARWFSKTILPVIRDESKAKKEDALFSPVFQHIGLYGYRMDVLDKFCGTPQSFYEQLEGLEQLRLLENGIKIQTVQVEESVHGGIDSPEDLQRAESRTAA